VGLGRRLGTGQHGPDDLGYSLPNRGLTALYVFGFAGWTIGAAGTIRYVRHRFGADVYIIALSVAGWVVGALVAVVLGLFRAETWNVGFLGLIVGPAVGGAIGGALTLPMRSPSSPATIVRASVRGALSWGAAFLVFQFLAFYTGYILMLMTAVPLASIVGWVWATVPGWALPAGVCGFLAARLACRYSQLNERAAV
jgi:hypothetical protein